ncbi:MAG: HD domain-containing protein [Gemmataceae bacterium]|nr:HD domain-containing protein [Gemmataceae bacterium]MCI0742895.1 HD domain-containing protein [Gemmataceae bacterium]
MSKPKPPLVKLCEMTPGQGGDFFALLAERSRGATREGKPYFTCRFRDAQRTATYMVWEDGPWFAVCESEWRRGTFYKIRGLYEEHATYGPQIDVINIRAVTDDDSSDGFAPLEFVERSRYDVEAMYQELWNLGETAIADVPLRRLVLMILAQIAKQLKQAPATTNRFYPFAGGLLEHTLAVTHSCLHLVDKYAGVYGELQPPLNRDLVAAGAILHDIGRCVEFSEEIANPQRTVPGHLFGHLFLGRDLVRDAARELGDVDPELVQLLEHIVISHLNHPEWGSPRLPMIPEVLIIHHADDLDAKMEMYARCLLKDKEAGPFTARDPSLGKQLLKGRKR